MAKGPTKHSPMGGSAAYRFLVCQGSVGLSAGIADEDSEYAIEGDAAHGLAEECLISGRQAWSYVGQKHANGTAYTPAFTNPVDAYLSTLRDLCPDMVLGENCWVEYRFYCPELHPLFYSTSDFPYLSLETRTLDINDFKYGVGIAVDAEENEQGMYYACGVLQAMDLWTAVDTVNIRIHQPRGFHTKGKVRTWTTTVAALQTWLFEVLLPGMAKCAVLRNTKSGEHCRFCPARFNACPQLVADMEEFDAMSAKLNGKTAAELTADQLARYLELADLSKIAIAAAKKTAFGRLNAGHTVPGRKLVQGKTDRQFKDGAEAAARKLFGAAAFTAPALKSPAQLDDLPGGPAFTAQWAFKPKGALTVAKDDDPRTRISVDTKSMFTPVQRKGNGNGA